MWEFTIRTEPWVHAYMNREFTLIQVRIHAYKKLELTLMRSVNLRLYKAWIHAYTNRWFTHIRSVNSRLYKACSHVSGFRGSCVFKWWYSAWREYLCHHSTLPRPGCYKIHIFHFTRIFNDHLIFQRIKELTKLNYNSLYGMRKPNQFRFFLELISLFFVAIAYSINQL